MTTLADAREFLVELISQLFHADVLITEQAERIEALEAEVTRLRETLRKARGSLHERRAGPSMGEGPAVWSCERQWVRAASLSGPGRSGGPGCRASAGWRPTPGRGRRSHRSGGARLARAGRRGG
jgi:hypothetical protein